ncbi:MAG: HDOD domain-containing protein [Candidatus Latescibacteria bacterium]|jgi:putative nucleotidyltransferase with HDIG domain|nr:HDOD domain-containing protein [Candidatus Latescibacterota bacterium]
MAFQFIDEVKKVLETSLPSSSAGISKVIESTYDKSSNAKDVAKAIENEPTLTANILKVVNSAYYGTSSTVTSIQRAVVIMGFSTIKEMISSISFASCFSNAEAKDGNDPTGLWYHSVGTAKACQFVAEKTSGVSPDIAYLVGLLHDIGKILLILYFPDHFKGVANLAKEKNARFILAERKLLNTDHTIIGSMLCDMWSLPVDLKLAIEHHHNPAGCEKEYQKLANIVGLGDYLCREAEIGFPGDEKTVEPSPASMALLGLKPESRKDNIEDILSRLDASKSEIENFFRELESK